MKVVNNIIESHRFFCRKSQHYILGNWAEYEKEDYYYNKTDNPKKAGNYRFYRKYFLIAYAKFIYLSVFNK